VEETVSQHPTKKTLTPNNFCVQYPNVFFLGVLEPPFTWHQQKYEKLTSPILVTRHSLGGGPLLDIPTIGAPNVEDKGFVISSRKS